MSNESNSPKNHKEKQPNWFKRGMYGKSPKLKAWQRVFMIIGGVIGLVWWIVWGAPAIWRP